MLRCSLAGLITLMKSEKYSVFTEEFYKSQKDNFDKIIKNKSYYLIRDLPIEIASRILVPEIPQILSRQKKDGIWHIKNPLQVTYDILSAFKHINVLDDLIKDNRLKNVMEYILDKYDYHSLLIKSLIYCNTDQKDMSAINELVQDIQNTQNENGSWENTIVATVYHIEKLINLGVPSDAFCIQKGIFFLFEHFNEEWDALQGSGKAYGLKSNNIFSTENRELEFAAAEKYKEEMVPRLICYKHLGVMQNSYCLNLFMKIGFENDERIGSALDGIYSIFKTYNSLCYFKIQKKFIAKQKESRA